MLCIWLGICLPTPQGSDVDGDQDRPRGEPGRRRSEKWGTEGQREGKQGLGDREGEDGRDPETKARKNPQDLRALQKEREGQETGDSWESDLEAKDPERGKGPEGF